MLQKPCVSQDIVGSTFKKKDYMFVMEDVSQTIELLMTYYKSHTYQSFFIKWLQAL